MNRNPSHIPPVVSRAKTLKRPRKSGRFTSEQEALRGWAKSAIKSRNKS